MSEFQAWFFLAITFATAIGAFCAIYFGQRTSRQQATLYFINDYNKTSQVSEGLEVVRTFSSSEYKIDEIMKKGSASRKNFLFLMNQFEILAIGIKHGIYDKNMILDSFGRDLREIYDSSLPLITYIRNNEADSEAFEKFEKLANSIRTKHHLIIT